MPVSEACLENSELLSMEIQRLNNFTEFSPQSVLLGKKPSKFLTEPRPRFLILAMS